MITTDDVELWTPKLILFRKSNHKYKSYYKARPIGSRIANKKKITRREYMQLWRMHKLQEVTQ